MPTPSFLLKWENYLQKTFTQSQRVKILYFAHKASISNSYWENGYKILTGTGPPSFLHKIYPYMTQLKPLQVTTSWTVRRRTFCMMPTWLLKKIQTFTDDPPTKCSQGLYTSPVELFQIPIQVYKDSGGPMYGMADIWVEWKFRAVQPDQHPLVPIQRQNFMSHPTYSLGGAMGKAHNVPLLLFLPVLTFLSSPLFPALPPPIFSLLHL